MKSTEAAVIYYNYLVQFSLQVISLFSNPIDYFEIRQFLQAEAYSETSQASQMKRFAKIGSGGEMTASFTRKWNAC